MKVVKIKEHKDGSATMTYELGVADTKAIMKLAKTRNRKMSKRFCNEVIREALEDAVNRDKQGLGTP